MDGLVVQPGSMTFCLGGFFHFLGIVATALMG